MKSYFLEKTTLFFILISFLCVSSSAQMARKPSAYREPKGAMDKKPDSPKNSFASVKSRAEFDKIARVYHQNTPYAMPHTMFVIDRKNKNTIYYVNSQKYRFHKDFLYGTGLAALGTDVNKAVYLPEDRRFIVGTIAWQKTVDKWTWELWEGDLASGELIKLAHAAIKKTFFQEVSYKPNSLRQEDDSANLGLPRITQDELNKNQEYLALNTGKAIGRIHIIDKLDDTVEIGVNEILILKELPLGIPPVRGVIVAKPSSPLSHINILAKGWNIPNVYIKDADKLFKEFNEKWVTLDAGLTNYKIKPASLGDLKDPRAATPMGRDAPSDITIKKLTAISAMRKKDSIIFGAKSANLGEVINSKVPGIVVPDGFTVPFYWYDKFMNDNGLNKVVDEYLETYNFIHNPRFRKEKLEELRKMIQSGKFDDDLKKELIAKWKGQLGGKPVFIRSSSNAEDLPNFSGAGLYSSVANVKEDEKLIEAVKKVWSSLWNFNAYEARERNFVDHTTVYMSALIQIGIDMDRGGVLITKDPFDAENKNAVYISAVCGHNSNVVNNNGVPEQVLFNPRTNSVIIMTLSQQENSLRFDDQGDLKQTPDICVNKQSKRILSDAQVRGLSMAAGAIKRAFGNKAEQDIEWGILNGKLYIVQARPYISKD